MKLITFCLLLVFLFFWQHDATAAQIAFVQHAGRGPLASVPHPVLGDVGVRRAIAQCTNKDALMASVYPELSAEQRSALIAVTFVTTSSWAYSLPSATYPYSPTVGSNLLNSLGWVLSSGFEFRAKNGRELAFEMLDSGTAFRNTYLEEWANQLKACGIRLLRRTAPANIFFGDRTGLKARDFESTVFAWVAEQEPGGLTLYGCDYIPGPANSWNGNNYMGWCNTNANTALLQAVNTAQSQPTRKAFYATVINELAADVPTLPLFFRPDGAVVWEHIDFNIQTNSSEMIVTPAQSTTLVSSDLRGNTFAVDAPAAAVVQTTTLKFDPLWDTIYPVDENQGTVAAIRLTSFVSSPAISLASFDQPLTVTITYSDANLSQVFDEMTLRLVYYDANSQGWLNAVDTCPSGQTYEEFRPALNSYIVHVCHFTDFALVGTRNYHVFLPLSQR